MTTVEMATKEFTELAKAHRVPEDAVKDMLSIWSSGTAIPSTTIASNLLPAAVFTWTALHFNVCIHSPQLWHFRVVG